MLRLSREHHFPWDEDTCRNAAALGHLAVLELAKEHGCPGHGTCAVADEASGAPLIGWGISRVLINDVSLRYKYGKD